MDKSKSAQWKNKLLISMNQIIETIANLRISRNSL